MTARLSSPTWIAIAIAAGAVLVAVVLGFALWAAIGDAQISIAGWFAMGLGTLLTLAVGIGLMSLVFYSSRHGYDDPGPRG